MALKNYKTRIGGQIEPTYLSWQRMKSRCYNRKDVAYDRYGGRGIKVCDHWINSFENFLADMGHRTRLQQLERRDNDGHYEPNNCCWATKKEQARNRSSSKMLEFNGVTRSAAEWGEITGLGETVLARLSHGWSIEKSLTTPLNPSYAKGRVRKWRK